MPLTKKEKERVGKGAIVGGLLGACIGMPLLGAAAGGYVNYRNKTNRKKRKVI